MPPNTTVNPPPNGPPSPPTNRPVNPQHYRGAQNPQSNDPYGFIADPEPPTRQPLFDFAGGGMGSSKLGRAIIIGVGAVILIILAIVGNNFLNSANRAQRARLLEVAQAQTEIVRISEASSGKMNSETLKNVVINAQVSARSSLADVTPAIDGRGAKPKDKELKGKANKETDGVLSEAQHNSRFDEAYQEILKKQLEDLKILLEAAYFSGNPSEKEIMTSANEQADLLLEQLKKVR